MDKAFMADICIQALERPPIDLPSGNQLYLLRDDLLPFSFGGNKVRIAQEFVQNMYERGCDSLIMYGDRRSNLCRVLANLCHVRRIPCLMIATTEEQAASPSFNEALVNLFDVEVIECAKDGIAAAVDKAMQRFEVRGLKPYYIYGNRFGTGNEGVAARAYAGVYQQICAWEQTHGIQFDLIACPYGTGSTQGGLVAGSLKAHDQRKIVGISISSRPPERAHALLENAVREWFSHEGQPLPSDYRNHIHLECGYTLGGYGRSDERVRDLIDEVLQEASVPLDPTYTGKALRGLLDYLTAQDIHDKRILFVHTGGLPLFFDYMRERSNR